MIASEPEDVRGELAPARVRIPWLKRFVLRWRYYLDPEKLILRSEP